MEEADIYDFECPKCGHRWTVSEKELATVSSALLPAGKYVHCPKCQSSRVLHKKRGST